MYLIQHPHPMFSLEELFCALDDFCHWFEPQWQSQLLSQGLKTRRRDRQPHVFVVNEAEGVVEQRAVQQGIEGLAKREIVSGVKPGEKLVTEGKNRLVNGAPVEIIP